MPSAPLTYRSKRSSRSAPMSRISSASPTTFTGTSCRRRRPSDSDVNVPRRPRRMRPWESFARTGRSVSASSCTPSERASDSEIVDVIAPVSRSAVTCLPLAVTSTLSCSASGPATSGNQSAAGYVLGSDERSEPSAFCSGSRLRGCALTGDGAGADGERAEGARAVRASRGRVAAAGGAGGAVGGTCVGATCAGAAHVVTSIVAHATIR